MIRARFRIHVPEEEWVGELSRTFPDSTFRLLSGLRTEDGAIELGEVVTDEPEAVAEALVARPEVTDLEPLAIAEDRLLGKYETTGAGLYEFVTETGTPIEYPLVLRNGWMAFDLTGTREEFDRFRTALESGEEPFELRFVVDAGEPETLLTDRQREVLEAALRRGYFSVPRECTLAELAAALDVDKSTASGVIRRGEARLVKQFFARLTGRGR